MEPYRLFFPLGLLTAAAGAGLWIAFAAGRVAYPGLEHANLMTGGFLLLFAAGFLGTAAPRLTGTAPFGAGENAIGMLLGALLLWASVVRQPVYYSLCVLVTLLAMALTLGRRFLSGTRRPPVTFPMAAGGLVCGIVGQLAVLGAQTGALPMAAERWGRVTFHYGMMLGFALGIGAFLLAVFLGWEALPPGIAPAEADAGGREARPGAPLSEEEVAEQDRRLRSQILAWAFAGAALPLSFVLEIGAGPAAGGWVRASVATLVALRFWRLYRFPRRRSAHAFGAWLSGWCIVGGTVGYAAFPAFAVHAAHLEFIGGFGLMTLMVATRVTLVHGNHCVAPERRSVWLIAVIGLILLAAATRVSAPLTGEGYVRHLGYAAGAWTLALSVWCAAFLPKLIGKSAATLTGGVSQPDAT